MRGRIASYKCMAVLVVIAMAKDLLGHSEHETSEVKNGFKWCNTCNVRYIPEK